MSESPSKSPIISPWSRQRRSHLQQLQPFWRFFQAIVFTSNKTRKWEILWWSWEVVVSVPNTCTSSWSLQERYQLFTASVGSFAHQIAEIHGIPTVSTSSQKNMDYIFRYGARAIFDRDDPNMVSQVNQSYPNLCAVFDTVGSPTSSAKAAQLLGTRNGILCTVRPGKAHTENIPSNVKVCDVFVFTAFLKEHSYRGRFNWPVRNHPVQYFLLSLVCNFQL